jgi:hypothetical protein
MLQIHIHEKIDIKFRNVILYVHGAEYHTQQAGRFFVPIQSFENGRDQWSYQTERNKERRVTNLIEITLYYDVLIRKEG